MKRKLFSAVLGVFAMLLLMGAAAVPERPAAALLAEEESAVLVDITLETDAKLFNAKLAQSVLAATGLDPLAVADAAEETANSVPTGDETLLIDGQPTPLTLGKHMVGSTTYVSLDVMAQLLDPSAQVGWEGSSLTVTANGLSLTAQLGQLYVVANCRYLYVPELVQGSEGGQVSVPLRTVAKAFGAAVNYDSATKVTSVTRGSGAIQSGDSYYDQEDLFWLSRVIYRESGNQTMEGQMAVGNVILKTVEGMGHVVSSKIREIFEKSIITKLAAVLVMGGIREFKQSMDYREYGGAPLLGTKKPVIKGHGSSDAKAVLSAIRQAKRFVETELTETIAKNITDMEAGTND